MKDFMRQLASVVLVYSGSCALGRNFCNRDGAMILYGHRVSDDDEGYLQGLKPEWLDQQLSYLTRHYEVIPLRTLVDCFEKGQQVPHRSVVLTFDDGFRDNLAHAFPLLQRYRVPASIFVVTGSLTHGDLPWSQRLGFLFQRTSERWLEHSLAGQGLDLSTAVNRFHAYRTVKKPISHMGRADRDRTIAELSSFLRVEPPQDRMLNWDEARELQATGIEIGAHTYSHALLANISPEEARWEMEKSRDDLKEQLDVTRPMFCFPAGSRNAVLIHQVMELGFRSVFVPNRRIRINNLDQVNQFSMSRVGLPNAPGVILEAELDGPFHAIRSAFIK